MNLPFLYRDYLHLFYVATLFMVVFQLVTRLTAYTFMFHQGVLLLASALIGAGIGMLLLQFVSEQHRTVIEEQLPLVLVISWLVYLFLFFGTQDFLWHFVVLMVLFGSFFIRITRMISLTPNHFTAIELAGSFIGVAGLVFASHYVLEEYLIIGVSILLFVYLFCTYRATQLWSIFGLVLGLLTVITVYPLFTQTLPDLITCPDRRETYKIACLETTASFTLVDSIPNIKGRSDVYINTGTSIPRLSVYNSGLHSGTSLAREEYAQLPYSYHDVEIPPLAYRPSSTVVTAGASTGSNVQTFQKYIPGADVTAVEIDTIITDLYASGSYDEFLPLPDSFRFVFQDGRTYFDTSASTYDVISMMVESVNTTLVPYVDESTSLVYTTEALETYVDALAPNGYLLLQQFHAYGEIGDAMIHKVLASLEQALPSKQASAFEENLLLYSYAFSPDPGTQMFLAAVYKPDGFTEADMRIFNDWISVMNTGAQREHGNGALITVRHTPDGSVRYDSYFNSEQRVFLSEKYNTSVITDDVPFRHLITTLPFPIQYYAFMIVALLFVCALVLGISLRRRGPSGGYLLTAFGVGVLTFGLQYVLYYKTAAFLGTSLIFFSVFLLVPLLFGAIGGYLSHVLRPVPMSALVIVSIFASYLLVQGSVFSLAPVIVFSIIAILFLFSGTIFPLLLAQVLKKSDRSMLYALNMCGGGFAAIATITLHAIIGWNYLFISLLAGLFICFVALYRQFVRH